MRSLRRELLVQVLDGVVVDDLLAAERAASAGLSADPVWAGSLLAYTLFMQQRFAEATETADTALAAAGPNDPLGLGLARAARGLVTAGSDDRELGGPDPLADLAAALPVGDDDAAAFVRYLAAEASLACARLNLAAAIVERSPEPSFDHPYGVIERVMRVRLLAFRGAIAEATELLDSAPRGATPLIRLLVQATGILVGGNASERGSVRALADGVEALPHVAGSYLTSGCALLAAFGLVAIGDVQRAARLALGPSGDADLSLYTVIDRALCYELLVAAAVVDDDLDAAEAWAERATVLTGSLIAGSTADRLASRLALLQGRPVDAVMLADRAVAAARADGRIVEAAEGEIVAARARIATSRPGEAAARLESMVEAADSVGHASARRAAARELRAIGRRLRPAPGSDWSGLSEREHDVALLLGEGMSNREIAVALHLSEHTVRSHVARVLAAFGAASRSRVAARLAELLPPAPVPDAPLTPRQRAVVELIGQGAGNAEIAAELGLSVKTVEAHVGDVLRRWELPSRVAIARAARALGPAE